MPALTAYLPREAIEAFEQSARTLALAEPGADAGKVMALLLAGLAQLDAGATLAAIPAEGERQAVSLDVPAGVLADLAALAVPLGLEPGEAASRILAAVAREGPAAALQAINTRRIGRRRKGGTGR